MIAVIQQRGAVVDRIDDIGGRPVPGEPGLAQVERDRSAAAVEERVRGRVGGIDPSRRVAERFGVIAHQFGSFGKPAVIRGVAALEVGREGQPVVEIAAEQRVRRRRGFEGHRLRDDRVRLGQGVDRKPADAERRNVGRPGAELAVPDVARVLRRVGIVVEVVVRRDILGVADEQHPLRLDQMGGVVVGDPVADLHCGRHRRPAGDGLRAHDERRDAERHLVRAQRVGRGQEVGMRDDQETRPEQVQIRYQDRRAELLERERLVQGERQGRQRQALEVPVDPVECGQGLGVDQPIDHETIAGIVEYRDQVARIVGENAPGRVIAERRELEGGDIGVALEYRRPIERLAGLPRAFQV